jgi:acetyl-CoA carboxylase carboxyl transferase subunit alpha
MANSDPPRPRSAQPAQQDGYLLEFEKPIVELERKITEMRAYADLEGLEVGDELHDLERRVERLRRQTYSKLTRWQRVQIARHPQRPHTLDYIAQLMSDFFELHGDRAFSDDPSIVGGIARFEGTPIVVVGHQKGRDTRENIERNWGMPHPEGYRKARRLFELAEKFGLPIVTLIDTMGAYPGIGAEERGQAEAIARNLMVMSRLKTPILVIIIGEGASGGALGIGVGDRVLMFEHGWYAVIAPESCSTILYRSRDKKEEAADNMKVCAEDLLALGIVDRIIPEATGGAHRDPETAVNNLRVALREELAALLKVPAEQLIEQRAEKLARMGIWEED